MKRLLIFLLFASVFSTSANAQVTLEECREMARQNHPSIRMYGLINATRDFSISNASRLWIPAIQIGAIGGIYNNPPKISDLFSNSKHSKIGQYLVDEILHKQMNLQDLPDYSGKVSAALSQSIYDGGLSKTSKKIAEAQARVQSAETDVTLSQVCDRVDEIYFSILLLEKRILQIDSKMEVLNAARDRMAALHDAGVSRRDEADELDAVCIETQQQRGSLESSLKSFRAALSLLAGQDLMSEEFQIPSPLVQPQAVPQTLLLDRRKALLALEKDKLDVTLRPCLDLVADAYYGYPNRNIFKDFVSRQPGLNAFVGLRLSWNLSSFRTRKNDLAILSKSLEKIDVQKDILKLDTRIQNESANIEIERLRQCMERDSELVSIRERLRKSAELSYSQGELDTDKLLSKIDDEYHARLNAQIHEIESLRESYKLKEE